MTDVLLDCDPGHDDAIAMLLAGAREDCSLVGVTTVAGNQTVEKTTRNAQRMLTLMDRPEIPVAKGMGEPLARELTIADHVHGETGLDGPELPAPAGSLEDRHAVEFIIDTVAERDGITLVPVGPLTNVALALKRAPEIADGIDEIVWMGGAVRHANITPAAEFNAFVDPEAAQYVFQSGIDITMVGLDVTFQSAVEPDEVEEIRALGEVGGIVAAFLDFAAEYYTSTHGLDGYPIHDAVALAHALDGVVETREMRVDVESNSEFCDGRTVCDVDGRTDRPANATVGLGLDRTAFVDGLIDALATYD
ncbi:MAG: nucleoside hydrolase [Halobacteriaceae archaeon]